jgi:hypothetical protein
MVEMRWQALFVASVVSAHAVRALGADWPQFNLDARKSGTSLKEAVIHRGNVATLHPTYHVTLPGVADGAPVFLAGAATPSGEKDLLFVTTKNGWIAALDAATGGLVWSHQPATGPNYTTSSPAIDPNRQYVYSYGLEGRVHKYQVGDGTEITAGGWPELATLKPSVEKESPGLAVAVAANGTPYLYVANGGYPGDAGDYQGHVTAVDLATGAQRVFNANCSDQPVHFTLGGSPDCAAVQSAIWARAGVVYDAVSDRIFMATGNGSFNANTGGHNWGDSVFALHPDGTGTGTGPVDSYTPAEYQQLQNADADLGSTAPALFPVLPGSSVPHVGLQSGKDSELRLLNIDDLSGTGSPGHVGGELQKMPLPQGGPVLTAPAVWQNPADSRIWAFVANGSGVSGLELTAGSGGVPLLVSRWTRGNGGTSPVVVNGILFYASYTGLRALDPVSGTQLWSDASIGGIHWESPIVVNGRLYVTDEGGNLWAYAPDPAPLRLYTVTPCRVLDTRLAPGPAGGPAIGGGGTRRLLTVAGRCGVPPDSLAIAANVTVVNPAAPGYLGVSPSGVATLTSTINFPVGRTRANNVTVALTGNPLGCLWIENDSPAPADVVLDVSGYFK